MKVQECMYAHEKYVLEDVTTCEMRMVIWEVREREQVHVWIYVESFNQRDCQKSSYIQSNSPRNIYMLKYKGTIQNNIYISNNSVIKKMHPPPHSFILE